MSREEARKAGILTWATKKKGAMNLNVKASNKDQRTICKALHLSNKKIFLDNLI